MSDPRPDTPAMRQYRQFKEQFPDCILFFRMGDFYEMFYEDARLAHRVLGVTLTQRTEGIPMAGVPFHAVESYLRRMIKAGYRVAVCDQMEDAAAAKSSKSSVIARDVTRVITPGTLTDDTLLDEGKTNPLAAVMFHGDRVPGSGFRVPGQGQSSDALSPAPDTRGPTPEYASLAWAELSTGSFHMATLTELELADELGRIGPREVLYVETANLEPPQRVKDAISGMTCPIVARPAWHFRQAEAVECLCRQFRVASLAGFGLTGKEPALGPAAAIVQYLLETQRATGDGMRGPELGIKSPTGTPQPRIDRIAHLQPPKAFVRSEHLIIDQTSLRSLEIEQTTRSGKAEGTLLATLQSCRTPMGKRMLRHWLCYPLRDRVAIESRQRIVGAMVEDTLFLEKLREALEGIQDIQRILARIAVARGLPRDLVALGTSCAQAGKLVDLLADRPAVKAFYDIVKSVIAELDSLSQAILIACCDTPPAHLRDGGLIKDGVDALLDEYRGLQRDSNTWLAGYQKQLIEQTGINSLKVGYNRIFGYYIELTASNKDKAPAAWSRKQTLKNCERFITQELKDFEGKVLSAQDRAIAREQEIFTDLCEAAKRQMSPLHALADAVAQVDVLACFARRAVKFRYVKPMLVDEPALHVEGGRHPVLDELLAEKFVANDVELGWRVAGGGYRDECATKATGDGVPDPTPETRNPKPATLALITGPNMAGKSTYIRQAALITLLAHTGSFVPADRAVVGLCDRIFTRIGASDELHTGQSTFMVEMTETANICHHATAASLVILDEIGRGTSTLDGLSLAWAIAEHLARRGCRTMFATHYHELTQLPEKYPNVINLNVTVREWQGEIVFLHRIVPGAASRSYGIHVAKIAGLPPEVISRADELLAQLSVSHNGSIVDEGDDKPSGKKSIRPVPAQMSLFTEYVNHPVIEDLRKVDLDTLSPMQAFELLRSMRGKLDG
jgi:DNA mismatch repair protein MutS